MQLDNTDRRLLNLIQTDFPICTEPYRVLAEKLGTTEEDVLHRLEQLMSNDIIRRLGGVFDSRKLGYKGTSVPLRFLLIALMK
ncbi:hypothetical protein N752_26395 [Desulforamulus aquiferis]|nr:hypothetical protein N752_26395 [Desulforamulus aquiferis]